MAGGCPIVAGIHGQGKKLIEEAMSGICVEPEDSVAMQEAIMKLFNDKNLREECGNNGRIYAKNNFSRREIATRYLKAIEGINAINGGSAKSD